MSDMGLFVDCSSESGPGETTRPLTDVENSARSVVLAEQDTVGRQQNAARQATATARQQLKAKAKTDANLALVCQAMGIDPNAAG